MRLIELVTTAAMITASMAAPVPEKESGRLAKRFNLGNLDLETVGDIASAAGAAFQQSHKDKKSSKESSRSGDLYGLGTTNYQSSGSSYSLGQPKKPDFLSALATNINKLNGKSTYDSTYDSTYGRYGSDWGTSTSDYPSRSLYRSMNNMGTSTLGRTGATVSGGNGVYNLPPAIQPPQANNADKAAAVPGGSTGGAVVSTPPSTVDMSGYPSGSGGDLSATPDSSTRAALARLRASMGGSSYDTSGDASV